MESEKELLTSKDLQKMGISRTRAYQLLDRPDLPVVTLGGRKFMHRKLFSQWLETQAKKGENKDAATLQ